MSKNETKIATKDSWEEIHPKPEDIATDSWEGLNPMPMEYSSIPLDFRLNARQAMRVRQGFIPAAMEEKWFCYFENDTLFQYRSWTGYCIDQVHFVADGDGLRATHAEVNRNSRQYSNTDDSEDIERIARMVLELGNLPLGAKSQQADSFVAVMQTAMQPNYLGSADVMNLVVLPFYESCIREWISESYPIEMDYVTVESTKKILMNILRGRDKSYTLIGTWNSTSELGQVAIKYFCLDADYCEGESLGFILIQSLDAIQVRISSLLDVASESLDEEENDFEELEDTLIELLAPIKDFSVAVFMGTNTVLMPDKTLIEFEWGKGIG